MQINMFSTVLGFPVHQERAVRGLAFSSFVWLHVQQQLQLADLASVLPCACKEAYNLQRTHEL